MSENKNAYEPKIDYVELPNFSMVSEDGTANLKASVLTRKIMGRMTVFPRLMVYFKEDENKTAEENEKTKHERIITVPFTPDAFATWIDLVTRIAGNTNVADDELSQDNLNFIWENGVKTDKIDVVATLTYKKEAMMSFLEISNPAGKKARFKFALDDRFYKYRKNKNAFATDRLSSIVAKVSLTNLLDEFKRASLQIIGLKSRDEKRSKKPDTQS